MAILDKHTVRFGTRDFRFTLISQTDQDRVEEAIKLTEKLYDYCNLYPDIFEKIVIKQGEGDEGLIAEVFLTEEVDFNPEKDCTHTSLLKVSKQAAGE